ncbi:hypothetical protein PspS35_01270 [Pseudomonas sp. S35]|nr:hypothetical protein PspS35_01270 [Pseudomonas sp. S35]
MTWFLSRLPAEALRCSDAARLHQAERELSEIAVGNLPHFPPPYDTDRLQQSLQATNAGNSCRKRSNTATSHSQTAPNTRSTLYRRYPLLNENSAVSTFSAQTCEHRKDSIHRPLWRHLHTD